jgi:hypothetical protein
MCISSTVAPPENNDRPLVSLCRKECDMSFDPGRRGHTTMKELQDDCY